MTSFSLHIIIPITNNHFEFLRLLVSSTPNNLEKYDYNVNCDFNRYKFYLDCGINLPRLPSSRYPAVCRCECLVFLLLITRFMSRCELWHCQKSKFGTTRDANSLRLVFAKTKTNKLNYIFYFKRINN